ncbi:MAG: hypothetical protein VX409_02855 [Verrucomicrobiota bacterium]|nr:hypothetical protein [Verrucomicrobiota bacterium]
MDIGQEIAKRMELAQQLYAKVDNTPQVAPQTTVIADDEVIDPIVPCSNGQKYKQSELDRTFAGNCPPKVETDRPDFNQQSRENKRQLQESGIIEKKPQPSKPSPFLFVAIGIGIFLLLAGGRK